MKKIAVLLLLVLALAGCQMYKTKNTIIENKSGYAATVDAKNFKEDEKQILSYKFTVDSGKSLLLPMYDNGDVSLVSIGRNYLNKVTDTHYEILNADSAKFTIYNKTDFPVIVKDLNNLFDTQAIAANTNQSNIDVYNIERIQPTAITNDGTNLILKVSFSVYGKSILVSY